MIKNLNQNLMPLYSFHRVDVAPELNLELFREQGSQLELCHELPHEAVPRGFLPVGSFSHLTTTGTH